jgi:hypothetical protein
MYSALTLGIEDSHASSSLVKKTTQETSPYRAQANRDDGLFNHAKDQLKQGEHLEGQHKI